MAKIRNAYKNLDDKLERKKHLDEMCIEGSKILRLTLTKYGVQMWLGLNWLMIQSSSKFL
jgi:hypothetical protein